MSQNPDTARGFTLSERLLGTSFAWLLRSVGATWRVDVYGMEILDRLVDANERHILAFWHRKYLTLFPLLQYRPATVVTSLSSRGNVIAGICHSAGMNTVQIPDHGKSQSYRDLRRAYSKHVEIGVAVDGPLGPALRAKRGVIRLCADAGNTIVPVSVASRRKFVVSNRWDRLEIPLLFTRVALVIGSPMNVPEEKHISFADQANWADRLGKAIDRVDSAAEECVLERRRLNIVSKPL